MASAMSSCLQSTVSAAGRLGRRKGEGEKAAGSGGVVCQFGVCFEQVEDGYGEVAKGHGTLGALASACVSGKERPRLVNVAD
jgi:hypothetical protein